MSSFDNNIYSSPSWYDVLLFPWQLCLWQWCLLCAVATWWHFKKKFANGGASTHAPCFCCLRWELKIFHTRTSTRQICAASTLDLVLQPCSCLYQSVCNIWLQVCWYDYKINHRSVTSVVLLPCALAWTWCSSRFKTVVSVEVQF